MASTIDQIVKGMYSNIKPQQEQMHEYFNQLARRVGMAGASQFAANIAAPYATAAADTAGKASIQAATLDEQKREFEKKLAEQGRQFDIGQKNWEQQFAEYQKNQDLANMMSMFKNTGWTPQLLDALGYGGLGSGDMRNLSRQINVLGFNQPTLQGNTLQGGTLNRANNWGGRSGLIYK